MMTIPFDQFPNENRRSPRVDGKGIKVEYYSTGNEASPTKAPVKNICFHGICICMPSISEGWKMIHMNIVPPGRTTPISATGSVVWYNMLEGDDYYNVGIEFQTISEEDQKWLEDYVKAISEK